MNTDMAAAMKLFTAIVLGILFIAAAIGGRTTDNGYEGIPGSILGALLDAEDMQNT